MPDKMVVTRNGVISVGSTIKIIDAGYGATGANGKIGVITKEEHTRGILADKPGYNVKCDNGIWRINPDAKIEILHI